MLKATIGKFLNQARLMSSNAVASKRAVLFPGQGSQFVGMGKDLYDQYPAAKAVFDEADQAIPGLSSIVFQGPEETLKSTANAQPALLTTSIAMIRVLEGFGFDMKKMDYALGHSLGEYTTLVATNALSLSDGVKLVRLRGEAMTASLKVNGTMSALMVRKNKLAELKRVVKETQAVLPTDEVVSIANNNSSIQVVISGTRTGVEQTVEKLQKLKIIARAMELPVSAPFHCSLMKEAGDVMEKALSKADIKMPCTNVISNVTARPYKSINEISSRLVEQMVTTVEWEGSINYCREHKVNEFVCFGPGQVLANLLKKDYPSDLIRPIDNVEAISKYTY